MNSVSAICEPDYEFLAETERLQFSMLAAFASYVETVPYAH
jgi:hypothetical protein